MVIVRTVSTLYAFGETPATNGKSGK
jgi:hypothetical protein